MNKFFDLFDKSVSEYYLQMMKLSDLQINLITESGLSEKKVEKITNDIFSIHFVYPTLKLDKTEKSKEVLHLNVHLLKKLFPSDKFPSSEKAETVTQLCYNIIYFGWAEAMRYSLNFDKIHVRGSLSRGSIFHNRGTIQLLFYFRSLDLDLYGSQIRAQKDELLSFIETNVVSIAGYFEDRKKDFKRSIIERIRSKVEANDKYRMELDKF